MTFFTEIYPFEDFTSAHKPRGGSSAYSISDRPSFFLKVIVKTFPKSPTAKKNSHPLCIRGDITVGQFCKNRPK